MRRFIPLQDRVLVLPDAPAQKVGGLSQPTSQQEEPTEGVVVSIGQDVLKNPHLVDGKMVGESAVYAGVRVQWAKYSGREVMHEGKKHRLLRLEEIDGVLEDSE